MFLLYLYMPFFCFCYYVLSWLTLLSCSLIPVYVLCFLRALFLLGFASTQFAVLLFYPFLWLFLSYFRVSALQISSFSILLYCIVFPIVLSSPGLLALLLTFLLPLVGPFVQLAFLDLVSPEYFSTICSLITLFFLPAKIKFVI